MYPGPCFKRNWESISRTTFTQTPWIWLVVSIIEWFNTFLMLPFTHLCRICHFEESWSQFNKPFGVYDCYLAHIFLSCHYKLVVYDPVWLPLEQSWTWMNIYRLILNKGSVTFLGVLSSCMKKEPCSDSLPDLGEVFSSTHDIQFVPENQCWWVRVQFNINDTLHDQCHHNNYKPHNHSKMLVTIIAMRSPK